MEATVGMRSNIILTTLPYASKAWTWNVAQKSQIRTVMSYIRGAFGVSRWDDASSEEMYQFLYRNSKLSGLWRNLCGEMWQFDNQSINQ